ncbi:hypothetical protein SAMN04487901_108128 [Prevotella communis]|uniref:Uncharacterized protein n=1 Tax=Prevotella communis TaxID=2913614 RepID=A0A1G7WQ10_9BACT|nr:hypothetical protein SAMN04487901_108128 [Prevotella communis]
MKKSSKMFGGSEKKSYLCIRFRLTTGKALKKEFFERFT